MKPFATIVGICMLLLGLLVPATSSLAAPAQPFLSEERALTGNGNYKLPSVAAGNSLVNIGWSAPSAAIFTNRPETSGDFATTTLGSIGNNSTYFNVAVAVGADQATHVAWIESGNSIQYRKRGAGQNFGGTQTIAGGLNFANGVSIAVQGDANVFVAWRTADGGISFVWSSNGGANWSGVAGVPIRNAAYAGAPSLAANGSGTIILTWTGIDGNIYVGQWNGNNFANDTITGGGKHDYFNPTVAIAPDGTPVIAWRSVARGVFYAERAGNGGWAISNLFAHTSVAGPVAVGMDGQGDVHLAWSSKQGGNFNVWYAIRTPGNSFSAPIPVSRDGSGYKIDVDVAASVTNGVATAHVVWESFTGGQFIRYARVTTPVGGTPPPPPPPTPTPAPTPPPGPPAPETGNFGFANAAFESLWTRTDSLVATNRVNYSWIWGPKPFTASVTEPYAQSPNGGRQVQYFDKSRMEINQPGAPQNQYYVTNGRLADELITGVLQVGDSQYEQHAPAGIALAGDPTNTFPLYRDLKSVYHVQRNSDRANEIMSRTPDGGVHIDPLPSANNDPSMVISSRVNGLGIPAIFWQYMNQPGQVVQAGKVVTARPLFDWRYVIGEPLTEAYWTVVTVGGKSQGVLVQAFERRVLTYTPGNPAPYQVEMGNIGRHYFEWRYGVPPRS